MNDRSRIETCLAIEKLGMEECLAVGQRFPDALGHLACAQCVGLMVEKNDRLEEKNAEWKNLALTDELTGMRNLRFLVHAFEKFAKEGNPFGGISVDISNFKAVNDEHGHNKGDKLIKVTADYLKNSVRPEGDLPARIGSGEEDDLEIGEGISEAVRKGGDEFFILATLLAREGEETQDNISQWGRLHAMSTRIVNGFLDVGEIADYNSAANEDQQLRLKVGYAVHEDGMSLEKLAVLCDPKGRR